MMTGPARVIPPPLAARYPLRIAAIAVVLCLATFFCVFISLGFSLTDLDNPERMFNPDPWAYEMPFLTILPLDDAYIHLNYARSIATLRPYQYNPGDPATSGATSFLYPYLLIPGIWLTFNANPLDAALWSNLLGALGFITSASLVTVLAWRMGARQSWGVAGIVFVFSGFMFWHAMSGMETLLITAATLLALYGLAARSTRWGVTGGALCALLRPEGAILAVLTSAALYLHAINTPPPIRFVRLIPRRYQMRRDLLLLLIPLLAIGVQPLVNWIMTGSPGSTGGSAKSLLGMVPFDAGIVAGRIVENFIRIWRDLLLGNGPDHTIGVLFVLAIAGWIMLVRRDRLTALTLLAWALLLAGAIATLDTAFWHLRRYQIPLIATVFPLAALAASPVLIALYRRPRIRALVIASSSVLLIVGCGLGMLHYVGVLATNQYAMLIQPLNLAVDLKDHFRRGDRVAVHDVGLMRYIGGLHTIDMVGLTTPGAAAWWRQGPGAVGEYLDQVRPELIASYGEGHGVGLGYLANTDLYAETLSEYTFSGQLWDEAVVALAAPTQGLYRPDYTTADNAQRTILQDYAGLFNGARLVDYLDVANLDSEAAHDYRWWNDGYLTGFATEWHQFPLAGCVGEGCVSMDGGRRITGGEEFTLNVAPDEHLWLIARVHAGAAVTNSVWVDGIADSAWSPAGSSMTFSIPQQRGEWVDIPFFIARDVVRDRSQLRVRIQRGAALGGVYEPYAYFVYQNSGDFMFTAPDTDPLAQFQMDTLQLRLPEPPRITSDNRAILGLSWWQNAPVSNIKRFVHVSDAEENIVAQVDGFISNGAFPSLPHGAVSDPIDLDLTAVAPGTYTVYVGLYDPATLERLPAVGERADSANRIRIGTITLEEPTS